MSVVNPVRVLVFGLEQVECQAMDYLTVEVEIDQGRILAREPEKLPAKGAGLLTIFPAADSTDTPTRPFGLAQGEFFVPGDFNTPLPDKVLREFEGG